MKIVMYISRYTAYMQLQYIYTYTLRLFNAAIEHHNF